MKLYTREEGGGGGVRGLPISPIIANTLRLCPKRGTFLRLLLRFIKDREFTVEVNKRVDIKMGLKLKCFETDLLYYDYIVFIY